CSRRAGINLKRYSTLDAMETNETPVLFVHGKGDTFVPMEMTVAAYEACKAPKKLLLVDDAPHAMSFLFGTEAYIETAHAFFAECEA
ncbi:MAG: alpha/beta hydrolase, partial [Firmicutes bacterium]|nr:alpha/beta hydrolase [Bacillota bacterium]